MGESMKKVIFSVIFVFAVNCLWAIDYETLKNSKPWHALVTFIEDFSTRTSAGRDMQIEKMAGQKITWAALVIDSSDDGLGHYYLIMTPNFENLLSAVEDEIKLEKDFKEPIPNVKLNVYCSRDFAASVRRNELVKFVGTVSKWNAPDSDNGPPTIDVQSDE
jgi:hypothetical protein